MRKKTALKKINWKKFQTDSQKKKRLLLGLLVLGLIIILVLLGKLLGFVGALGQPFAPDSKISTRDYLWDSDAPVNIVVKSDQISLISYQPKSNSLAVIKIPNETYLNVPLNYGRWSARSIYSLGQSDDIQSGANLLKLTMESTFAVPIDGYLLFDDQTQIDKILDDIRSSPFGFLNYLPGSKTDLSLWEYLRLIWELKNVRFDRITNIDLSQNESTNWVVLPDGRRVLEVDQRSLDKNTAALILDEEIEQENVNLVILNSTKHQGLAEKAARMISNLGGRVVEIGTIEESLSETLVIGDKSSYTFNRLESFFAPRCLKKNILVMVLGSSCDSEVKQFIQAQQSQITIVLGEDYYLRFNNPID